MFTRYKVASLFSLVASLSQATSDYSRLVVVCVSAVESQYIIFCSIAQQLLLCDCWCYCVSAVQFEVGLAKESG